jgi:hypothetical protein
MCFYDSENGMFTVRYELRLLVQYMSFLEFKRLNSHVSDPSGHVL